MFLRCDDDDDGAILSRWSFEYSLEGNYQGFVCKCNAYYKRYYKPCFLISKPQTFLVCSTLIRKGWIWKGIKKKEQFCFLSDNWACRIK